MKVVRKPAKKPARAASPPQTKRPMGYFVLNKIRANKWTDVAEWIGDNGLYYKNVEPLFEFLELGQDEIARITGVSARTLSRWDDNVQIGAITSERIAKIDTLVKSAIDIFGSEEAFKTWFAGKNFSMGGKSPKELLGQPFGLDLIEDSLQAVQFGNMM